MENKSYRSDVTGEVRTYEQWKGWAIRFYKGLQDKEYRDLPDNWFTRVSKARKLEEIVL